MTGNFANSLYDNDRIDDAGLIIHQAIKGLIQRPDEYLSPSGGTDTNWLGTIEINGLMLQV
jgi:hypothetical protein